MADRLQWEKFWYRDFCDDLRRVPLDVRGFWLFALAEMWGQEKSEISGTIEDWSRICSCTPDEAQKCIEILEKYQICEYEKTHIINDASNSSQEIVKLKNRRLKREEKAREYNRLAKQKERGVIDRQGNVKKMSAGRGSEEQRNRGIKERNIKKESFEFFWNSYPKKIGKIAAWKAWLKAKDKPQIEIILQKLSEQKKSTQWTKDNGQFIPMPATWLNQGRWDDKLSTTTIKREAKPNPNCPQCGKETTQDDLDKFNSCPACYKPVHQQKIKDLINSIGKTIK